MLGPRIAALRREAGMSQSELAVRLKVSASAVGMYEQGRREPSLQQIVALSELFSVSTDYLLTGKAQTEEEEQSLKRVLLNSLSDGERAMGKRRQQPFSRDELAVLMTAMLMDS